MVKRVTKNWISGEDQGLVEFALQHIGTKWSMEEREKVLKDISYAFFPPNQRADVWTGYDQTHRTVNNEPYYPISIVLNQRPDVWFKNLRLLQIRQKLNLVKSIRINLGQESSTIGSVYAKLKALEGVVGKEMMSSDYIPELKRPRMMSTRSRIANDRAESLRRAGLNARQP